MTTNEKAIKIMEEMVKIEKITGSWESAKEEIKKHYNLTDKQFAGMIFLAFN